MLHSRPGEESAAVEKATSAFPALGAKLRQPAPSCPAASSRCCRWPAPGSPTPAWSWWTRRRWAWPRSSSTRSSVPRPDRRLGTALLLVEQYVNRALALANTVYVLSKGGVVFTGTPAEITDDLFAHYLGAAAGAH